ncbi:hypothetical protein E2C01_081297 [Portunus trituberculatus]|uniref:Uncharacterized protein n=1 Tax=Portunus trituberculatus TaxID=210409 RepID=A0A5B7J0R2_PORTR|nr:hypothetical protein [Portunus trituberculatus]
MWCGAGVCAGVRRGVLGGGGDSGGGALLDQRQWDSLGSGVLLPSKTSLGRRSRLLRDQRLQGAARAFPIGAVSWFFSRPVFTPLCRLSYCMFLVSLPLQALAAARPHKIHYDHLTAAYLVLGDLCLSALVSVVVLLLVEAPAARLLTLLTSGSGIYLLFSFLCNHLFSPQRKLFLGHSSVAGVTSAAS